MSYRRKFTSPTKPDEPEPKPREYWTVIPFLTPEEAQDCLTESGYCGEVLPGTKALIWGRNKARESPHFVKVIAPKPLPPAESNETIPTPDDEDDF